MRSAGSKSPIISHPRNLVSILLETPSYDPARRIRSFDDSRLSGLRNGETAKWPNVKNDGSALSADVNVFCGASSGSRPVSPQSSVRLFLRRL